MNLGGYNLSKIKKINDITDFAEIKEDEYREIHAIGNDVINSHKGATGFGGFISKVPFLGSVFASYGATVAGVDHLDKKFVSVHANDIASAIDDVQHELSKADRTGNWKSIQLKNALFKLELIYPQQTKYSGLPETPDLVAVIKEAIKNKSLAISDDVVTKFFANGPTALHFHSSNTFESFFGDNILDEVKDFLIPYFRGTSGQTGNSSEFVGSIITVKSKDGSTDRYFSDDIITTTLAENGVFSPSNPFAVKVSDRGSSNGGSGSSDGRSPLALDSSKPPKPRPENLKTHPVILDLDEDGIEISAANNISFDIDGDGFNEKTAWVSSDDGFLIVDFNANGTLSGSGDGKITQAKELILPKILHHGSSSTRPYGGRYKIWRQ